jgi:hypothetical protein
MPQRPEHIPGELAPAGGIYELLDIFGSPTGVRIKMEHGYPFPAAPRGHNWTLAEGDSAE